MPTEKKKEKIIKQLPNGSALFESGMVRTPRARLCFVNFVTPKENTNDDGKVTKSYGCCTLFKKGDDLRLLKLACERFATEQKGKNAAKYKWPLRLQDDKVGEYDGFTAGAYYMNNSSKYPIKAKGADLSEIDLSEFYSGCYARLTLRPYIYDNKGNRGVGLGIAAVQFSGNGEPLGGGGVDPEDVFDADDSGDEIGSDVDDDADGLL